ncbi:MAG: branched-chain amino acid transaminase [Chloroflexota bacterium]|nr:branched-chain amino acid transaminase [Chloroflexota bacterium]
MVQTLDPAVKTRGKEPEQKQVNHPQWAFFKGEFVPIADAKISIMSQVVNYGIGAFGGIRAYWNEDKRQLYIFRLNDHIRRFLGSCKLFNAALRYSAQDLNRIIIELLRREGYHEDAYARPLLYNATEDITPRLYDVDFDFTCFARPQGNYIRLSVRACTSSWRRLDDTIIPSRGKITGGYINSAFAKSEAYWNGYDEAIVLNQDGHVAEGSAMNLFIVRDGRLRTPAVSDNILEGITRNTIIHLAQNDLDLEVAERQIDRSELYIADEVFFCGTGAQVAGVVEIDHRSIGNGKVGPITQRLQEAYFAIVRGKTQKYMDWLTPVYS